MKTTEALQERLKEVNRVMGNDFYRHLCGVITRHIEAVIEEHGTVIKEELADIKETYRAIIDEPCRTDEKHCTCVPALRMEIDRLKKEYKECYAVKEKAYLVAMDADKAQRAATVKCREVLAIVAADGGLASAMEEWGNRAVMEGNASNIDWASFDDILSRHSGKPRPSTGGKGVK